MYIIAGTDTVGHHIIIRDAEHRTISQTSVAILSYFIAACRYPEMQRQLQAEIDEVIGDGRLPGLDDRVHLPYANAVTKEVRDSLFFVTKYTMCSRII